MKKSRILLGASYSVIEPLGLLHLGGLARDLGWERRFHLVREHDFEPLFEAVREFKPDVVGFNVYTGNHTQLREAFKRLKLDYPEIKTVAGGPHATYFPSETLDFADYVVMSEGFGALQKILREEAKPGILPLQDPAPFPQPDRETFYADYPDYAKSRIKSVITMTGCPFYCSYCYNASKPQNIAGNMPADVAEALVKKLGPKGRLFPKNIRSVDDVIAEGREIKEKWPTEVVYFQDDVHGFDLGWMEGFADRWPTEVGIPYHAQIRWEMTKQPKRLDLFAKGGCFGLTLAIEAANKTVRTEILNRTMDTEIMFSGMQDIVDRGMRVRTEQITGLPYGVTSVETPINLDADLELVELNVNLREKTKGPTMAWASTLAPYKGTNMGTICAQFGHYNGNNSDVKDTFFEESVLRFPKAWVGPEIGTLRKQIEALEHMGLQVPGELKIKYEGLCEKLRTDDSAWLPAEELEIYRKRNAELRRIFNFVTGVPEGQKLARNYLTGEGEFSYARLGKETVKHLKELSARNTTAASMLEGITSIRAQIDKMDLDESVWTDLDDLAPYFASIPKGELAVERVINYARRHMGSNGSSKVRGISAVTLSTAIRHHLYDEILYSTNGITRQAERSLIQERYPAKV